MWADSQKLRFPWRQVLNKNGVIWKPDAFLGTEAEGALLMFPMAEEDMNHLLAAANAGAASQAGDQPISLPHPPCSVLPQKSLVCPRGPHGHRHLTTPDNVCCLTLTQTQAV